MGKALPRDQPTWVPLLGLHSHTTPLLLGPRTLLQVRALGHPFTTEGWRSLLRGGMDGAPQSYQAWEGVFSVVDEGRSVTWLLCLALKWHSHSPGVGCPRAQLGPQQVPPALSSPVQKTQVISLECRGTFNGFSWLIVSFLSLYGHTVCAWDLHSPIFEFTRAWFGSLKISKFICLFYSLS